MRKKCSNDREKLLKFEAEGREFAKFVRSLEQFIQTIGNRILFQLVNGGFSIHDTDAKIASILLQIKALWNTFFTYIPADIE